MGDLKEAPAVHFNFILQSFSLYITFKRGIAPAGEPIPSEYGSFGEWPPEQTNMGIKYTHINFCVKP